MSQYQPEGTGRQSHLSADVRVDGHLFESPELRRKNLTFAIIMTIIQAVFCFLYGFLIYTPAQLINVTSIVTIIFFAVLIVAGFGLVFGYTKRLAWSGIGFNLFIVAFCLEYYPLINDFWTKTSIQKDNVGLNFSYGDRFYNLYLTNRQTTPAGTKTAYGNCIANAMKAALSMAVAFSSILGRAGQLECLIVNIVGVIGFELNRQLIQERIGSDSFGTFFIFTYGGFMGLALGLFCYLRERRHQNTIQEKSLARYKGQQQTVLFSILGALIIFAFLPFLAYQIDAYIYQPKFAVYTAPFLVVLAMGAGLIGSLIASFFFNGYLIARDATHGIIAGAIAVGSASLYIVVPAYALITGFIAGVLQGIIQNSLQRYGISKGYIFSTVSWSLFAIQGVIGGCFSAGWKRLANDRYGDSFTSSVLNNFGEQYQFYAMLISVGMGLGVGIIAGLLVYLVNFQRSDQYFDDSYYWRNADCIRPLIKQEVTKLEKASVKSQSVFLEFEEGNEQEVNNRHAYL